MQAGYSIDYALDHRRTGKRLRDMDTLLSAGVEQGDILSLLPNRTAGGLVPIRLFRDIQLVEAVTRHSESINQADGRTIFAVLLYTDADKSLSAYVRDNIAELHEISAPQCMFFVIERPSPELMPDVRKYLGDLTIKYFDAVWERLEFNTFRPFEKSKAYEVARHFEVAPQQLPCIVFFTRLKSRQVLTVDLNRFVPSKEQDTSQYTALFRILFSAVQEAMKSGPDSVLQVQEKSLKEERRREKQTGGGVNSLVKILEIITICDILCLKRKEARRMLRYQNEKTKAYRILDLTSLTVDEFEHLIPAFEAAFLQYMQQWTMEGKRRTGRRYSQYATCPLPTPEDRLLFILSYLKVAALQAAHGALFAMTQSNANKWIHVLLLVLDQTLSDLGDAPARHVQALRERLTKVQPGEGNEPCLFFTMGVNAQSLAPRCL